MIEQNVLQQEMDEVRGLVGRFQRGELTRPDFRSHSVHFGVYTQRQPDRYFVRIRAPLGIVNDSQLNAVAEISDRYGDGTCHFTTRQGIEIHQLSLENIVETLEALARVGLSSHESGGNTVRGIVMCPHAGDETCKPFDVTGCAGSLNAHLLRHPDFQALPRKIKIGFSCCASDCTNTVLHDLGFQARRDNAGRTGFRVMIGGGAGALPRLAKELLDFLPADDLIIFTEAFLRMFNRLGDRQNRRRSRVKFLVESLGVDRLRQEIQTEWAALKTAGRKWPSAPNTDAIGSRHMEESLLVTLEGGNVTSGQIRTLAALMQQHSTVCHITPEQNVLLRNIRTRQILSVCEVLAKAGLISENPKLRLTVCPGRAACSNAFTNSSAIARRISQKLSRTNKLAQPLRIRVSGCTNGCALHVMADVGLEGLGQRREGTIIPAYRLWVGGQAHQENPRLAMDLGVVPAQRAADCVCEVVAFYQRERHNGETLSQVLDRVGDKPFAAIVQEHQSGDLRELQTDVGEDVAYQIHGDAPSTTC